MDIRSFEAPFPIPADLPHDLAASFKAERYQRWILQRVSPYLGKRVFEVGAGCGLMSRWFQAAEQLTLTEPDPTLVQVLKDLAPHWFKAAQRISVHRLELPNGDLEPFKALDIDTVVSFNVLEHIEDDEAALRGLANLLKSSRTRSPKRLITFVPAHPFAYGAHDRYTGHFRRYDRARLSHLAAVIAPEATHHLESFNFFGLWGWWFKGRVLGDARIDAKTIAAFERLQPLLAPIDGLLTRQLRIPLGQSLISILEWPSQDHPLG